jgi:hypothetical protein
MTSDEPASPISPELFTLRRALFARDEQAASLARRLEAAEEEIRTLRAALAELTPIAATATGAPVPAPPPTRLSRRALGALWRLVRPIARPLAWRTRGFLFEPTRQALADLQATEARLAEAVEALARTLSASGPVAERVAGLAERIAGIAGTIDAALLTVALSPSPACDPPAGRDDPAPGANHPS